MVDKQLTRFSKGEMQQIKATFGERDELLYAIRKAMLQLDMKKEDVNLIKSLGAKDHKLLRRFFMPEIGEDGNVPLGQISSMWFHCFNDIKAIPAEDAEPIIESRRMLITYINQQLDFIKGLESESESMKLYEMIERKENSMEEVINIRTYNSIISFVEQLLSQIKTLANQKDETEEEKAERIAKDSSK